MYNSIRIPALLFSATAGLLDAEYEHQVYEHVLKTITMKDATMCCRMLPDIATDLLVLVMCLDGM